MSAETGVIHDIGYRRYTGRRLGRAADRPRPVLAQPALGLRLGPRRQGQDRAGDRLRGHVPARGGERGRGGQRRRRARCRYGTYVFPLRVVVMIIFVAAQAPELVSRDLRSHVLPLYFSRPMRRAGLPAGQAGRVHRRLPDHDRDPAAAAVPGHDHPGARRQRGLDPDQGADPRPARRGCCGPCCWPRSGWPLASLTGRRAFATGAIAIFFFLTWTPGQHPDRASRVTVGGTPPAARRRPASSLLPGADQAQLAGLVSPFTVLDGVRQWLRRHLDRARSPAPGGYGRAVRCSCSWCCWRPALGGLVARYRKAGAR